METKIGYKVFTQHKGDLYSYSLFFLSCMYTSAVLKNFKTIARHLLKYDLNIVYGKPCIALFASSNYAMQYVDRSNNFANEHINEHIFDLVVKRCEYTSYKASENIKVFDAIDFLLNAAKDKKSFKQATLQNGNIGYPKGTIFASSIKIIEEDT